MVALAMGAGCAQQQRRTGEAGRIIREFLDQESQRRGPYAAKVLWLDGPRWFEFDAVQGAARFTAPQPGDLLAKGPLRTELNTFPALDDITPLEDVGAPIGRDTCWIILVGERNSLIIYFGAFGGFAVGRERRDRFVSPSLAAALRAMFKANGLMTGYGGRCLDHDLRIAAGEKDVPDVAGPTRAEEEEMAEREAKRLQGLSYTMKESFASEGIPSEAEALSEAWRLPARGKKLNEVVNKGLGNTRLHQAAQHGHWRLAKLLLIKGADPNVENTLGDTPLDLAAGGGFEEIAALLLLKGADPNKGSPGDRPLEQAIFGGVGSNLGVVKLLIAAGANVNTKREEDGATPLIQSVQYGKLTVAGALCEAGADIEAKRKDGLSALDLALKQGKTEFANLLRKHGAKSVNSGK